MHLRLAIGILAILTFTIGWGVFESHPAEAVVINQEQVLNVASRITVIGWTGCWQEGAGTNVTVSWTGGGIDSVNLNPGGESFGPFSGNPKTYSLSSSLVHAKVTAIFTFKKPGAATLVSEYTVPEC